MKFHWPLQRLLDVTDKQELAAKAELFGVSRQIALAEEDKQRREAMIASLLDDIRQMDFQDRMNRHEFFMRSIDYSKAEIRKIESRINELYEQRKQIQQRLVQLRTKKDTLTKLREKAQQEFQRLDDLRQQQELDEAFQAGFVRRRRTCGVIA